MPQIENKAGLRKQLREQRNQLNPMERQQAGRGALRIVAQRRLVTAGRRIAVYWPFDGEMDSIDIISYAWSVGARVLLPVVSTLDKQRLTFAPCNPNTRLKPDRYGIPTPTVEASDILNAGHLDLVFLPVVGFDRAGTRLGMGAGYYDVTFEFLRTRRVWQRPRLIGLAYSFQEVASLPRDPWDVVMQGVVTEKEFIAARP